MFYQYNCIILTIKFKVNNDKESMLSFSLHVHIAHIFEL